MSVYSFKTLVNSNTLHGIISQKLVPFKSSRVRFRLHKVTAGMILMHVVQSEGHNRVLITTISLSHTNRPTPSKNTAAFCTLQTYHFHISAPNCQQNSVKTGDNQFLCPQPENCKVKRMKKKYLTIHTIWWNTCLNKRMIHTIIIKKFNYLPQ